MEVGGKIDSLLLGCSQTNWGNEIRGWDPWKGLEYMLECVVDAGAGGAGNGNSEGLGEHRQWASYLLATGLDRGP